jgi:DNA-binding NtrC family response regulator
MIAIDGITAGGAVDRKWTQTETELGSAQHPLARGLGVSLVVYHRNGTQIVQLHAGQALVIGRAPGVDIEITDSALSRQHARFELVEDEVWVEDLGSTNGTLLAGQRVQRAYVPAGAEVTMGAVMVQVRAGGPADLYRLRSHDEFLRDVAEEVYRARTFQRRLAVLLLGTPPNEETNISRWCQTIRQRLRPIDRMGVYGYSAVEILLPEMDEAGARALAEALITDEKPTPVSLLGGLALFPDSANSTEELLEACRTALLGATAKQPVQVAPARSVRSFESAADQQAAASAPERAVVHSEAMKEVWATVKRLAATSIPVLIFGETGTGKEVVARAIHHGGPRREKRMICVNCGAIPDQLLESVLFGHVKGAFTGAHKDQAGVFESADGGTLLLDEIGELPLQAQIALLRVLETKRVTRVGATREVPVDVRVLAATHQNLEEMCQAGRFRWDLFYRLNGMSLEVPPLRKRPEDIPPLVEHFIAQANSANHCQVESIDGGALQLLCECPWAGNVRELRNVIERAVVIAHDNVITADDLPELVRRKHEEREAQRADPDASVAGVAAADAERPASSVSGLSLLEEGREFHALVQEKVEEFERALLREALEACGWNQSEAARRLRLPLRTLARKVKLYGLARRR